MKTFKGKLTDEVTHKELPFVISAEFGRIYIAFKGYGDCTSKNGRGIPLIIEYFDKELLVRAYSDINREDPVMNINMEGAKENKRTK